MNDLGPRIRARRKELGWTLQVLAEKASCSKAFLCDVERGKRRIGSDLLLGLCQVLGLSMDDAMRGTGEPCRPGTLVPELPQALLAWAAGTEVPFRHVLVLYYLFRVLENYRTAARQQKAEEFDWPKFYDAVKEFL